MTHTEPVAILGNAEGATHTMRAELGDEHFVVWVRADGDDGPAALATTIVEQWLQAMRSAPAFVELDDVSPVTPSPDAIARCVVATYLEMYAEGVNENLRDDAWNREDELDEEPNADGDFPVVEDYLNDAMRIRMGEWPSNQLTLEVLWDETGPAALCDDPQSYLVLVMQLDREVA